MKNKINFFLLSAVLLGTSVARAQADKAVTGECKSCGEKPSPVITVLHYTLDNRIHYTVADCVPMSDVELYSSPSGGEVVAIAKANEKGIADFMVKAGTEVSFALNHDRVNEKGVAGKGQILVIPPVSLDMKSPDVQVMGNDISITWDASALAGNWHFTLEKSKDNSLYTPVYQTDATAGRTQAYSFREKTDAAQPLTYYRVVAENGQGIRVISEVGTAKLTGGKTFFTASPTVFSNNVQVTVPADKLPATYSVTDALGRTKFATGIISKPAQLLSLNLISGSYRLTIIDKNGTSGMLWLIRQ